MTPRATIRPSSAAPAIAAILGVPDRQALSWSTRTTLNALSLAVILHVAVWRRWLAV